MAEVFGATVADLLDGYVALEVVVLVKAIDEDGDPCWLVRVSEGVSDAERVGILQLEAHRTLQFASAAFQSDGDDDAST